jgi:hypothetical protein
MIRNGRYVEPPAPPQKKLQKILGVGCGVVLDFLKSIDIFFYGDQ